MLRNAFAFVVDNRNAAPFAECWRVVPYPGIGRPAEIRQVAVIIAEQIDAALPAEVSH